MAPVELPAADVPRGAVVPVCMDGADYVLWRARGSGRLCAMARQCPHLDWDLAEGSVVGDELVCPGHGWAFDTHGHAFKRNLLGRIDPKDDVEILPVGEVDGAIHVNRAGA
jgi:nitrite reductase/ring-hydroxylating ferredoxin subunit